MPRKQAKSTRFVKNVKNNTALANQRMQASSRKRTAKLMKKRSVYGWRTGSGPTCVQSLRAGAVAGTQSATVEVPNTMVLPCLPDLAFR